MAKHFSELRAWQAARVFKLSIYRLVQSSKVAGEVKLASQLRESAASGTSQIAEGFGRFDPADFARFLKIARASLIEAQNHLIDASDRGLIEEDDVREANEAARLALMELSGLLDYLQSPEAKQKAQQLRHARVARRRERIRRGGTPTD